MSAENLSLSLSLSTQDVEARVPGHHVVDLISKQVIAGYSAGVGGGRGRSQEVRSLSNTSICCYRFSLLAADPGADSSCPKPRIRIQRCCADI
jgi:hypothetical protein